MPLDGSTGFSTMPNAKYYDLYKRGAKENQANNYAANSTKKGDAMYETSSSASGSTSWNGDQSFFGDSTAPWLVRGGAHNSRADAGLFCFYVTTGVAASNLSFRVVCAQ